MFRFVIITLLLAAAAAFFTNPGEERAEALLGDRIMQAVAAQDVSLDNGAAGNALLVGCKLRPSDCISLLQTQIETRYTDMKLFSTYSASGFGFRTWCLGAYTRLFCPGGFRDA